jgi:hypothetical protein
MLAMKQVIIVDSSNTLIPASGFAALAIVVLG